MRRPPAVRRAIVALIATACAAALAGPSRAAEPQPLLGLDPGGHMALIRTLVLTPDGKQLISAGDDKVIRIGDLETGRTLRMLRGEINEGAAGKIYALAISPDGRWLAAGGRINESRAGKHPIRLYDLTTGEIAALLHGHDSIVLSLAFSADGRLLASAGSDKTAILWDVENRAKLRQLKGHTDEINRVAFPLDGERLATAGDDRRVFIWRLRDGRSLTRSAPFRGRVYGLAVSPVTGEIAASTIEGELALLDDQSLRTIRALDSKGAEFEHLTFSPDGRFLLTGAGAPPFPSMVVDVERLQPSFIYRGHQGVVKATAITRDGRLAVTAGGGGHEIHVWDMSSGALIRSMKGSGAHVLAAGFSGDGRAIAFGQTSAFRSFHDRGPLEYIVRLGDANSPTEMPRRQELQIAKEFSRAVPATQDLALTHRIGKHGYDANLDVWRQR